MQGYGAWAVCTNYRKGPPPLSSIDVSTVSSSRRDTIVRWLISQGQSRTWVLISTEDLERVFARDYLDHAVIKVWVLREEDATKFARETHAEKRTDDTGT